MLLNSAFIVRGLAILLACIVTWAQTINSNVAGGIPVPAAQLADCQNACLNAISCTGVDWDTRQPPLSQCFLFFLPTLDRLSTGFSGCSHYDIVRNCKYTICNRRSTACSYQWSKWLLYCKELRSRRIRILPSTWHKQSDGGRIAVGWKCSDTYQCIVRLLIWCIYTAIAVISNNWPFKIKFKIEEEKK